MTTIWTEFDFQVVVRRKGRRKGETMTVREQAPFEIPAATAEDAPEVLRYWGAERPPGTGSIRFHDGALYAPLVDKDHRPIQAAGSPAAEAHTELSETELCSLFIEPKAKVFLQGDLPLGSHVISSERNTEYAKKQREAAANLLEIDSALFLRVPEPMLVVIVEWLAGERVGPRVRVDYEPFPGALDHAVAANKAPKRIVVAQVPLHREDLASEIAKRVAIELGLPPDRTPRRVQFPHQMSGETQVVDPAKLRCDPFVATLDRVIGYLLKASHETLLSANDAFVLAWADMRESQEGLRAAHPDAPELAHRSMHEFLSHAPGRDEFRVQTVYERWSSRTLPALKATLAALPHLKAYASKIEAASAPQLA